MTPNTQTKKKWEKVATKPTFSLFQGTEDPEAYEVSWPKSKGYGRRRFRAETKERALVLAPIVAGLVPDGRGKRQTLSDAFKAAVAASNRGPKSTKDWWYEVGRFMKWLADKHPACEHWDLLTRPMVRGYLATFDGKADNTRRLALQPVCQTAGYMWREHGVPNVAEQLGIGSNPTKTPAVVYLVDVLDFLDYLRSENPRLETGVALQGLVGLRVTEALRLTWDRVDMERGLIEISGKVKRPWSERVIPVVGRVREALETARTIRTMSKVQYMKNQPVLIDANGNGYRHHDAYGRAFKRAIKRWNGKVGWAPKDLRNCLVTFSETEGVRNSMWKQYEGRAPESVEERHYFPRLSAISRGEQAELDHRMGLFHKHVVDPLEEAIRGSLEKKDMEDDQRQAKRNPSDFEDFLNPRALTV